MPSNYIPIGKNVRIGISDPWDFCVKNGSRRAGIISAVEFDSNDNPWILIDLAEPLLSTFGSLNECWAKFRYADTNIEELQNGAGAACNFHRLGPQHQPSQDGIFIGSLRVIS